MDYYHIVKQNLITREKILNIINKTEETIKHGLSIQDMIPLFQEFRLQVRVRDQFYKVIFSYDLIVRNPHNNVLYCLADGNHIYTLNHNSKRLQQMKENETDMLYVSSDYRTHHDDEPDVYHYMIDSVNDIIKILKSEEAVKKKKQFT